MCLSLNFILDSALLSFYSCAVPPSVWHPHTHRSVCPYPSFCVAPSYPSSSLLSHSGPLLTLLKAPSDPCSNNVHLPIFPALYVSIHPLGMHAGHDSDIQAQFCPHASTAHSWAVPEGPARTSCAAQLAPSCRSCCCCCCGCCSACCCCCACACTPAAVETGPAPSPPSPRSRARRSRLRAVRRRRATCTAGWRRRSNRSTTQRILRNRRHAHLCVRSACCATLDRLTSRSLSVSLSQFAILLTEPSSPITSGPRWSICTGPCPRPNCAAPPRPRVTSPGAGRTSTCNCEPRRRSGQLLRVAAGSND